MKIERHEMWNVIYRAYQAGYFGPPAWPTDPLEKQVVADRANLLHLAAGGPDGITPISEGDGRRLVDALEELFNHELYFQLHGMLTFTTLEGLRWRPREAGPF